MTGGGEGGGFKKPMKLCNEVKVEAESANSDTVEVTAATFTRRRINGIQGYMHCVCNSSKSRMHGCTHGYYKCGMKKSQKNILSLFKDMQVLQT